MKEGKMKKGGQNLTCQITQRPPDPPPMRRTLQIEWRCPDCGKEVCAHARAAVSEIERLRAALIARPTQAEHDALAARLRRIAGIASYRDGADSYATLAGKLDAIRAEADA